MEVFIRNVPHEATEKQIKQYFRPILAELNINIFHCMKPRKQGYAKITFQDIQLGQHFLNKHGQAQPGRQGFRTVKQQLYHMNRPINCSLSNNPPDEFVLKSLEREAATKAVAAHHRKPKVPKTGSTQSQRIFNISYVACGSMDYNGSYLAFVEQYKATNAGVLVFGRRFILVEFHPLSPALPTKQIEISYDSIESLTLGKATNPFMTFSLAQAPKFFEKEPESDMGLALSLGQLGLYSKQRKQNDPNRRRVTAIDTSHQFVVASCLYYRFRVDPACIRAILALRRLSGYPDIVSWDVSVTTKPLFTAQMTELNRALDVDHYRKFTFEVKFQLQKLAQNGYLPPYKVVQLMQVISKTFLDPECSLLAKAVRRLSYQVPFAGAGTEASELSLPALQGLVVDNYITVLREKDYAKDVTQEYEQIASIHKATVTPAGIYLYGPEPEMKNRVLRTYSAFTSYFLQVTFADEDGEPLRYDRTSSLEELYQQRFKKVLGGNITIAGRPYEVNLSPLLSSRNG
ncbi:MAG: hypothetical protein Q9166_006195 [cf. Caloplaca sp. 2 TL-2023]